MKNSKRPIICALIFCCLLLSNFIAAGQEDYLKFSITTKDGLPSNNIYSTYIDSKNRLWICTDKGVSLYNGFSYQNFDMQDGLTDQEIFSAVEDKKGRIWFTTYNNKPCYYYQDSIYKLDKDFEPSRRFGLHYITCSDTNIMFAVGNTLYCLINNKIQKYTYPSKETNQLQVIIGGKQLTKDEYFIIHTEGLSIFNLEQNIHKTVYTDSSIKSANMAMTGKDSIFFIHLGDLFSLNNNHKYFLKHLDSKVGIDPGYRITNNNGNLWILNSIKGADKVSFKGKALIISHLFPELTINSVTEDDFGGYWISTPNEGLVYYNKYVNAFRPPEFINQSSKLFLLNNNLYISNKAGQLYNFSLKELINYCPNYNLNRVVSILENENFLFIGCDRGVFKYDKKLKISKCIYKGATKGMTLLKRHLYIASSYELFNYNIDNESINPIFENKIYAICKDKDGVCFASTGYIYHLDVDKNKVQKISPYLNSTILKLEYKNDSYFILTSGEGLQILHQDKFIGITKKTINDLGIINDFYLENDSTLWITENYEIKRLTLKLENKAVALSFILALNKDYVLDNCVVRDSLIMIGTNAGTIFLNANSLFSKEVSVSFEGFYKENQFYVTHSDIVETSSHYNNIKLKINITNFICPFKYGIFYKESDLNNLTRFTNDKIDIYNKVPGNYEVIFNVLNYYNKDTKSVKIKITPQFYETLWFFLCILLTVIFIIIFIVLRYLAKIKKNNEEYIRVTELESKLFTAQLNPHFIFNSLNTINSYIISNEKLKANEYLTKFARLIRNFLMDSRTNHITIKREIENLQMYLQLESIRFPNKFLYSITNEVDEDIKIPPMLLQPFIENAIKHGFVRKEAVGNLLIKFTSYNKFIKCYVIDDGIGILQSVRNETADRLGESLKIINDRMKAYNKIKAGYQVEYIDRIKSEKINGTIVIITIPIDENYV